VDSFKTLIEVKAFENHHYDIGKHFPRFEMGISLEGADKTLIYHLESAKKFFKISKLLKS